MQDGSQIKEEERPVEVDGVPRRRFLHWLTLLAAGTAASVTGLVKISDVMADTAPPVASSKNDIAKHQWVFLVDLRRCDGCGKCTKACQKMHYLNEDQEWIKVYEMKSASGQTYYMPRLCMQCDNPPCVKVCPVRATYKEEDGVIVVDQNRCIGCRTCMAACPYESRYFNWSEPENAPKTLSKPTPEWPVPQQKGTVGKCLSCVHNTREGKLPGCVQACSMQALYIGDLNQDLATNGREIVKLSKFMRDNDVVRYKEELGTKPRVYYVLGHGQDLQY